MLRKALSVLTAGAMAVGLLHGPSMMLGAAVAAGIDCHAATAHAPATHSHMPASHDHASTAAVPDIAPLGDHGQATSNCPLANIAGIAAPSPDLPIRSEGTQITAVEPAALIASILDLTDPPPRSLA